MQTGESVLVSIFLDDGGSLKQEFWLLTRWRAAATAVLQGNFSMMRKAASSGSKWARGARGGTGGHYWGFGRQSGCHKLPGILRGLDTCGGAQSPRQRDLQATSGASVVTPSTEYLTFTHENQVLQAARGIRFLVARGPRPLPNARDSSTAHLKQGTEGFLSALRRV